MGSRKVVLSKRVRATALAFGILMGLPLGLRAQLSVDELEVFLRPGQAGSEAGSVRVTNDTDKAVQAFVEIQDWDRDENGGNRFFPNGTLSRSCKDQLKVFPMTLRIEPHRSETLRVSFEGPVSASCWSIAFIQATEPRQDVRRSAITYVIRTGVKVYVEPQNAKRDAVIEDMQVALVKHAKDSNPADTVLVRETQIRFHNTGDAHLKTKGALEIRRADNTVVEKLEIPEFPAVPGAVRLVTVPMPAGLAPGAYVALALLDYAGQEIAAGQVEFEVR